MLNPIDHFKVAAQWPGLWKAARLQVTLFWYRHHCFSFVNQGVLMLRRIAFSWQKLGGLYQSEVTSTVAAIQRSRHRAENCKMVYSQVLPIRYHPLGHGILLQHSGWIFSNCYIRIRRECSWQLRLLLNRKSLQKKFLWYFPCMGLHCKFKFHSSTKKYYMNMAYRAQTVPWWKSWQDLWRSL